MSAKSLLAAAAIAACSASAHAQYTVGPNVNITRLSGNQAEGAIAVNPVNPQQLFMFVNPSSGNSLTGAVSTNGGANWTVRTMANGADGLASACCDPSCAFDGFGNLFIAYINSSTNAVIVGRSTNGGASFTQIGSFSGSIDQPTLTVGANSVWVTYNLSGTINARGASVTGLGVTGAFSAAQAVPGGSGNFGDIAIGPAGQVIVAYENPSGGQTAATLFTSLDADGLGSGGFAAPLAATTTNVGGFDFITPQPNRSVDAEIGFAWDRSGGAFNGRLYMVYTEETPDESNNTDIMLRISNNNGASWSAPVRLNTDSATRAQFLPRIAIDQSTGHIAVIWYDARNDANNVRSEIWGCASIDGGATFLPNVKISAGASQSTTAGSGIDFGDYIGLTMWNDTFYPVWADNSNSTGDNPNGVNGAFDQYTAKVTIVFGSCCAANGACTRTVSTLCTGTFTASGVCSPSPCLGACCVAGVCTSTTQAACTGTFTAATSCSPSPCLGACCITGTCSSTTQAACTGGFTAGAVCSPNPCPPVVPPNDSCGSAAPLALNVTAAGTNVGATTDTTIVDTTICGQSTAATSGLDVFWQFTAPATGVYTVNTCGSSFDTVLTVHTACPATDSNKVACNDDSSQNTACASGNLQSRIPAVALAAGTTYYVRVAGFNNAAGTIGLTINNLNPLGACCTIMGCAPTDSAACTGSFLSGGVCAPYPCPPPPNDACGPGNPALTLGVTVTGTTLAATTNTAIVDTTICGQSTAANSGADVFFQFTAPATANYTVDTCGSGFDTVLTVHAACPATDANKIACNDDSAINTACSNSAVNSRIPTVTLAAGSTYTVRVAGYSNATGTYNLTINALNTLGACCAADATCSPTDGPNCSGYFLSGQACSPSPCPAIPGACCTGMNCASSTLGACASGFQGPGSACGPAGNPTTCCPVNYNGVDGVNVQDIFDFLTGWFNGVAQADFNHDGSKNIQDVFDFLAGWFVGCH